MTIEKTIHNKGQKTSKVTRKVGQNPNAPYLPKNAQVVYRHGWTDRSIRTHGKKYTQIYYNG